MNSEYVKENYTFEILNEKHNLSEFDCNSEDLNDFLKNHAMKQQNMNLSLTQLIVCEKKIIGFVSILTDTIKLNLIEDQEIKDEITRELNISANNEIPAVKIGRFAIDRKYAKRGIGSHVLRNILLSILNLSRTKIGLRFITVDSYAIALPFYVEKNNFNYRKSDLRNIQKLDKIIDHNPERQFVLHLDLKDIQLTNEELKELKSSF